MAVKASIQKIILKGIWRSAQANSQTLREALDAAFDAQYQVVGDGNTIVSTSGSGYTVSYAVPRGLEISVMSVMEAVSELDDLYDCALSKASENTDESRYAWMLSMIRQPTRVGYFMRGIRL